MSGELLTVVGGKPSYICDQKCQKYSILCKGKEDTQEKNTEQGGNSVFPYLGREKLSFFHYNCPFYHLSFDFAYSGFCLANFLHTTLTFRNRTEKERPGRKGTDGQGT